MTVQRRGSSAATSSRLALVLLAGGLVALTLGVVGRVHTPTGTPLLTFGFSSPIAMKATLTSVAALLAVVQVTLALRMYGRFGAGPAPRWVGPAHRVVGASVLLVTLPVAAHCLWALGFQSYDTRVLVHSLLGCALYGAYVAKVLAVEVPGVPSRALPWLGGTLFAVVSGLWLSASLWYYTNVGFPGL
jgi:hypothetical protein